jgi:4-hydroxythreonine-4-phosphate dehydrogenase
MTDPATKPVIAITMGDPCGVGPEIIVKALHSPEIGQICVPFVIGDRLAMERALSICNSHLKIHEIARPEDALTAREGTVPLLALSRLAADDIQFGRPAAAAGDAVFRYICTAAQLCLDDRIAAMTTAPISKEAMHRAGHDYPGHTELLAELCGTDDYVMMLAGDLLRVSLVTIHEALADVPGLVTYEKVLKTIRVTEEGVRRLTGIPRPRLAVLALNPHCGEGGMFGNEERDIITPAIEAARAAGIDAIGPLSADTLFHFILKNYEESNLAAEAGGEEGATQTYMPIRRGAPDAANELVRRKSAPSLYDGVVAMYHDQGLIPLKMVHFDDGVNITLGLPIIRTSVDHGTAYDLAGTGKASEKSLFAAIRMAVGMAMR